MIPSAMPQETLNLLEVSPYWIGPIRISTENMSQKFDFLQAESRLLDIYGQISFVELIYYSSHTFEMLSHR